jgi:serine phosphatase RsbU (regulator of sigma subunit)
VLWAEPRSLSLDEKRYLDTVARLTTSALDRALRWVRQGELADVLLAAVVPDEPRPPRGFEIAARYLPAAAGGVAGGDWYDVLAFDQTLFAVVGDVAGHGLAAVQDMAQLRLAVRAAAAADSNPASVTTFAGLTAQSLTHAGFATLCSLRWQPDGELAVVRAGHPYPMIRWPDGTVEVLDEPSGPPLGTHSDAVYAVTRRKLPTGAALVLYTDGLVEQRGEALNVGIERLRIAVAAWDGARLDELVDQVTEPISGGALDDVCILAIRTRVS